MNKKVYWALTIVLLIGLVVGGTGVIRHQLDLRQGARDYTDAAVLAGITAQPVKDTEAPETPETPAEAKPLTELDLDALRQVNAEVIGWLSIPGTSISYPLLQGADNDYYLSHTWKREDSAVGSIFMDFRNTPALEDFNTLIYGHRMRNESMFGILSGYQDQSFWEAAPSVYLVTQDGVSRYDIYAAYEVSVTERAYRLDLGTEEEKTDFIRFGLESSAIDTGLTPTAQDKILTLSTCTGRGHATRWIVQAYWVQRY